MLLATAFLSYFFAECLHWSGIISLIGCGVMQKRYAFPNASKKTYHTVKYSVKTMASVSDCVIFLFLGKVVFDFELDFSQPAFIIWTLLLCLAVRFAGVFLFSALLNQRVYTYI